MDGQSPVIPKHSVVGPPPMFVRGDTPFWLAACGCTASAREWRYCPKHGAAPELLAALKACLEQIGAGYAPSIREDMVGRLPAVKRARAALRKAQEG